MLPTLEIYCDLDGVLFDFNRQLAVILGHDTPLEQLSSKDRGLAWQQISKASNNYKFWSEMQLYDGAHELINLIAPYNGTILTAMGFSGLPLHEKAAAVQRHFGCHPTIFVNRSKDKARFAGPNKILIDDRLKSIDPWIKNGGIGIHHVDIETTIQTLQQYFK